MAIAAPLSAMLAPPKEYPFAFFCQERQTIYDVLQWVLDAYTCGDHSDHLPPTIVSIVDFMHCLYQQELIYRALLRDDVFWYGSSIKEDYEAALKAGVVADPEEYLEYMVDGGIPLSVYDESGYGGNANGTTEFGEMFVDDVEYVLQQFGMFYVYVVGEERDELTLLTPPLDIRNGPIVEVW